VVSAAPDYTELHRLIDRLAPEQVAELQEHALQLVSGAGRRFRRLRSFDGPATDLGARAKHVARAELGEDDADR